MNSYFYSKWKDGPLDSPVEFYTELDPARWEQRKVEVFRDGHLGYASSTHSTYGTRLAIVPVPSLAEIATQPEFEVKPIEAGEFEAVWKRAAAH
jgi:hypothetical protein